jgi:outer membrane immunogenic protein
MKKFLFASAALITTGLSAPAMAADMPVKAIYKAPASYFSWTRCFVGGNVGGVWVTKDYTDKTSGLNAGSHTANSWLGGFQVGCDYQFAGDWVIGIQGDYDWMNAGASHIDANTGITLSSNARSLASVTGRLGHAWDRFLGYVRGGVAWERDNYTVTVPTAVFFGRGVIPGFSADASETRSGFVIGVGGEYAFTDLLSGFVEYDYYGFGTRSNTFTNPNTGLGFAYDIRERKNVIKMGLNFRFGGGAVVAKY